MTDKFQFQNIGRELQKDLLSDWYQNLATAKERKRPVAYLFISGNIVELLRPFGIEVVYPEVNALQCGIKKIAGELIERAEDIGYASDVCGYVKNDIGLFLRDGVGPFGKIPPPDLLLCNYAGCTTYIKWFEALSRFFDAPLFMLDVPWGRDEGSKDTDLDYVVKQLRELIALCEKLSGVKYDPDKLKEVLDYSRRSEDLWVKILHSAKNQPSPFDSFFEAVFFMSPIYVLRGTPECLDYYEKAYEEIKERMDAGIGPIVEERFRVVIEGPPPWPHFRTFWEMFKKWGACCVASTYSKVGGIWDRGFRHNTDDPLRSIAEYCLECYTNYNMGARLDLLEEYYRDYKADGLVIHSVKSCRSFSVGQGDFREYFTKTRGIPTLFVESDLADPRYFSEAQMRNRIDAYFEALEHRKYVSTNR